MKSSKYIIRITAMASLVFICSFTGPDKDTQPSNEWPYRIEAEKGTVVIYQPQVESFTGDRLGAMAAISVTTAESQEPVFGAMWFDCRVTTDKENRTVTLMEVNVTAAKFPDIRDENIDKLSQFVKQELEKWQPVGSLDRIMADLELSEKEDAFTEKFNNSPPEIIYTTIPSVLISIDGDPVFKEIENSPYEYVVNTSFFIVKDNKTSICYLKGGDWWYSASQTLGPWSTINNPPGDISKLAEQAMESSENEEAGVEESKPENPVIPGILVRTKPAELIQTNGEATFAPLSGTSLLYATNSDDFILMDINKQEYYVLISGRWFRSASLTQGAWSFVKPEELPADFAKIPPDSDMGGLLTSVPGTKEAKDALLENSVPQTATVDRKSATVKVDYDGRPKFEEIPGTSMQYAVNCDKSVLLIDKTYYCVDNAVWFTSDSPTGPWEVCVVVPESVKQIPPESPVYNVKYVYVYDYTPDVVYVGYTPGYCYSYAYHGCIVYGTGWYYRPWYGIYYYPHPVTYGFNACWNPYTGWGFSFGISFGNPYAWFSFGWHSPYYGFWGPAGYRYGYYHGYHSGYARGYYHGYARGYWAGSAARSRNQGNYRPQTRPTPYTTNNIYRNRANGVRQTGGITYDPSSGRQLSAARPSTMDKKATKGTRPVNNVYTDKNGNVYRQKGDKWQSRENGKWNSTSEKVKPEARPSTKPATRPETRPAAKPEGRPSARPSTQPQTRPSQTDFNNLNRSYQNRSAGTQRTQQYHNYQRNTTPAVRSMPSGAGARGGGIRR